MSELYTRYRMRVDLRRVRLPCPELPRSYRWVPWRSMLQERHAQVKWNSFRRDLDGQIFPCLSQMEGCRRLMREIASQPDFCPDATWLVTHQSEHSSDSMVPSVDCAVIQGIARRSGTGAIQNVGVIPEHRGLGIGRALLLQSLRGFRLHGMTNSCLEVTAENGPAVRLYLSLGFEVYEQLQRERETDTTEVSEPAPQQNSTYTESEFRW
ncbi:MAG: GNAT family N-acetyltransferase [Planctomyces sp.]